MQHPGGWVLIFDVSMHKKINVLKDLTYYRGFLLVILDYGNEDTKKLENYFRAKKHKTWVD